MIEEVAAGVDTPVVAAAGSVQEPAVPLNHKREN
jgi:hypothetical protein